MDGHINASGNEVPNHILIYTADDLTWDSAADVDQQTGVAELSLFNSTYQNVRSANEDRVIAPGTEGKNIIRLKNEADISMEYIAVIYRIKEEKSLPVQLVLEDDTAFIDTKTYPLPEGVTEKQVIRAVTGTVEATEEQDFCITWSWEYYESNERDQIDTTLGNKAAWAIPDAVLAGVYIVVEKNTDIGNLYLDNSYIYPQVPQTGDYNHIALYIILAAVSVLFLLAHFTKYRKEKRCGQA